MMLHVTAGRERIEVRSVSLLRALARVKSADMGKECIYRAERVVGLGEGIGKGEVGGPSTRARNASDPSDPIRSVGGEGVQALVADKGEQDSRKLLLRAPNPVLGLEGDCAKKECGSGTDMKPKGARSTYKS